MILTGLMESLNTLRIRVARVRVKLSFASLSEITLTSIEHVFILSRERKTYWTYFNIKSPSGNPDHKLRQDYKINYFMPRHIYIV